MSGHSKWHNIQQAKGKADAARGKIFTKIGREIAVAVKAGGPDPSSNAALRAVIDKAKANNMPKDNITRSIQKANGELGSINYESIVYEGYGTNGVAVIVEALTDNKNRTGGEVRHIFDKAGGSLGTSGCVSYMFDTKGVITVLRKEGMDDDEMMMAALDAGAEDFDVDGDYYEIVTSPTDFASVRDALAAAGIEYESAELQRIPQNTIFLDDESRDKLLKMLDAFEDNDDVQNVYHNAEYNEEE
ncbi:MAG TPA: YebC/PmpR family DNA-binding transcriptional regulator [Candidatus Protoclostridium stercorigallinarum]|mgnify:FL=1|uniref:Probable transcriptional regulatory protein H9892_04160 n=1 Tax=Candidatus Protoclostridium stercorigallinarum TaxID=2838741 RepID=A0A9D1PZK5_9FIRM|nr:YebC/PmpR family DNA-binding transcriptional regulator [Candidatus Protoclostridium stercorigallinarum]